MDVREELPVFDNVKYEKAKAIARYNRFRKITKFLQFVEVFVALILISWSSTKLPLVMKFSANLLLQLTGYIFKPHVVFLIGNAIIVSLFILCRENNAAHQNSGSGDIYDDYVRHSQAQTQQPKVSVSLDTDKTSPPPAEIKETTADSVIGIDHEETKEIVLCEPSEEECDAVATAIESATKQIEKFQRTQSAKLKRDIAAKPHQGELRRSETVTERHRVVEKQVMTSFESMDSLSIEEFNLTVDNFIRRMKTPEFIMKQKLLENYQELKN